MDTKFVLALAILGKISESKLVEISYSSVNCATIGALVHVLAREFSVTVSQSDVEAAHDKASKLIEEMTKKNITVLSPKSLEFPARLKTIPEPPALLFVKGNVQALNNTRAIAIIGSRDATDFARQGAMQLAELFTKNGYVIISGLAVGCDKAAHQGCLNAGGQTIAVMAHGLYYVYPQENTDLAEQIVRNGGCLVSEYLPGEKAQRHYFVRRDRIQSGLSDGVVVAQSGIPGGSLYTAAACKRQNRLLASFVVPEKLKTSASFAGNKKLLTDGACPIQAIEEIKSYHARMHPAFPFETDIGQWNTFYKRWFTVADAQQGFLPNLFTDNSLLASSGKKKPLEEKQETNSNASAHKKVAIQKQEDELATVATTTTATTQDGIFKRYGQTTHTKSQTFISTYFSKNNAKK